MGYRIEYSGGQAFLRQLTVRKKGRWWAVAVALALISLLIGPVRKNVYSVLIPGDDEVTIRAVRDLVGSLGDGGSVGEALAVFCQEIIYEGA